MRHRWCSCRQNGDLKAIWWPQCKRFDFLQRDWLNCTSLTLFLFGFFTVKWCGRTCCFHSQCQMTENHRCRCNCKCNAFCACVHTLESRTVSVTVRKCSTLFQFQTLVLTIVTTVQIDLTSQTNTKATEEAEENRVDKHAGILKCSWISLARSLTYSLTH